MKKKYRFEIHSNMLCIVCNGEILISDITGYLKYNGNDYNVITLAQSGAWQCNDNTAQCDNMTIELSEYGNGFLVRSTFTNSGSTVLDKPCEFTSFAGTLARTIDRAVINRYHYANGNRLCEMQSLIDTVRTVYNAVYDSAENTVFDTVEGDTFIFGAATYEKYFSGVTLSREGYITAHASTEWHNIAPGEAVTSEWFYFAGCRDAVSGLNDFAETVAAIAGVKRSALKNPSGFCTWYYYGGKITPDTLRDNMATLNSHQKDLPVKYIQIDDGWYDCWGSWLPNEKFSDIKSLADEIKARGFLPGIWLAPFGCNVNAKIFKEHPDWFVKRPNGEVWREPSIDYTNPEAREYMAGVFRRISYEWGFRYIKMDIISGTIAPGVHHDPNATALSNFRLGLKTFRENVTDDTFLLACTAPLGGACGLVNGMRVSGDVFERWESLLIVFNSVLKSYYYHRNYYLNDADCLIIRKKENEDKECWRLCTRTDDEIRTYVTAMAASGGILMLSDKLPNLSENQLRLISKLFPLNQEAALPLDIMDAYIPGVLDFGCHAGNRTVALINWGEAPRRMTVENGAAFVWEFWSESFCIHNGGSFTVDIPPRSARVYYFTPICKAAICGSDASVMMQSEWNADERMLNGKRIKTDERLFAAVKGTFNAACGCTYLQIAQNNGYNVYEIRPTDDKYSIEF